ncbi:MAG: hypothetical protein U0X86_000052 [Wolbachia endosymbiont of Xenopsylla cheopis]
MSELLVNTLKQATSENDYSGVDAIIEQGIQKIDDRNDFRYNLYNLRLLEDDILIQKNLSVLLAPFLSEKYIRAILKDKNLLNQLKSSKAELKVEKINFFTVVAGVVKEKKLLDKILTSQDIEQIYAECLQNGYSHQVYGLLEIAAMHNNVEFIDVFLNRAEKDILNKVEQTKQLTGSQESLNSLGSDESCDSGLGSDDSNGSDLDLNESYNSDDDSINGNGLITNSSKSNLPSNIFTKQEALEGLTANLVNVLSTAISMEAYETVNYLYDKFNKADSIEIKAAFIIALEHDEVRKEYEKQQTERPNSVKIKELMKEWDAIKYSQLRFQVVKSSIIVEDNINSLRQAGLYKISKDFKERMVAAYSSLDELKNSVVNILHTSINCESYDFIKNLSNDFYDQSINIKHAFDRALKNENIQKAMKNSKEIRKILCNDEQSILKMMGELVLKIKNLIEQIINYLSMGKDIKKQSSTADLSTSPSSNISPNSVHNNKALSR